MGPGMLRFWRFFTLAFAALALTMGSAHVLELPQKMQYDAQLYAAVNTTLYRYFGVVGAAYVVGSIVTAWILAFLVRRDRAVFSWTLSGAVLVTASFLSWLAVVAPVNDTVAAALQTAPQSVPLLWLELRTRWEYGHAAGFVLQLLGFGALLLSVLADSPQRVAVMVQHR